MCGIAGYVGPEQPGVLEAMAARVAHRGPDGQGWWHDPLHRAHLAHRRLAVLDRTGGAQPMETADGWLAVTFNGEIYNAPELRALLEKRGHRFHSDRSDTEVLLRGYCEWGESLPERLNGMWAFAIYDAKAQRLFASRDRFGEKPFYYHADRTGFIFGSELGAVRAHPDCPGALDRESLRKFFAYGFIPAPRTLLVGVAKLPAGHSLVYDATTSDLTVRRYWQYVLEPDPALEHADENPLAEKLRGFLDAAVRRRLVADVPSGVFLSGGIDSSAVAAATVAIKGRALVPSFTLGFDEGSFDESGKSRAMAAWLGTVHYTGVLDAPRAAGLLRTLPARLDEPVGDPSILATYALAELARPHVTVALGGDGGDELFAGYDTFRALRAADVYARAVPRPLHRAISLVAGRLPVGHRNLSLDFKLKRFLRGMEGSPGLWHPLWLAPVPPDDLRELFDEPIEVESLYAEAIALWDRTTGGTTERALQFFTQLYLPDNILTKTDRASMLHGLELRSPFLDIELVDFIRRLPTRLKLRGGSTKYLLRRALRDVLPAATIAQPKKGFGVPVGAWIRSGQLWPEGIEGVPGANPDFLRRAHSAHRSGQRDERQLLWCAAMLAPWRNGAFG